jgi:hypothetical protein
MIAHPQAFLNTATGKKTSRDLDFLHTRIKPE